MTVERPWGTPDGADHPQEKQRGPVVLRRSRLGEPTTTALTEKPNLSPAVRPTTAVTKTPTRAVTKTARKRK